jgi:hypothetical protein
MSWLPTHKYHAKPTMVGEKRFASKREAARYQELCLLQQVKAIKDLECQPVFPLHIMELWRHGPIEITTVGKYIADFRYLDLKSGEIVIEDVKGFKTDTYRLKKKIAEAVHGIVITEVH